MLSVCVRCIKTTLVNRWRSVFTPRHTTTTRLARPAGMAAAMWHGIRQMLHGQQHRCCVSDPAEEQLHVATPGATIITVLGDSLSSTEGRCNAITPWPMLLQDSLGAAGAFTVHGFAQPAISLRQYQGSEVWGRAITTRPDVLAIMLATLWKTDDQRLLGAVSLKLPPPPPAPALPASDQA